MGTTVTRDVPDVGRTERKITRRRTERAGTLTRMSVPCEASTANLLAVYDSRLRGRREMAHTSRVRQIGPVWVGEYATRGTGFVSYADLDGREGTRLDELIDDVVAYFDRDTSVTEFEWKTRGHDAPADLPQRLTARGFVPQEPETVMVGPARGVADRLTGGGTPNGVVVRQVGGFGDRHADLTSVLALQERVFGHPAGTVEECERLLDDRPDGMSFWLAEAEGRTVSAGRIEVVEGTDVAGLWGGVTHPDWRRRGVYRALTAARARWALARGVRYLHSDSTEFSSPILERSGLAAVTTTTPFIWKRPA